MAARVSLENSMHDWVAFFSRGCQLSVYPSPVTWHHLGTCHGRVESLLLKTLGPTFAKHTFYKSIHKGWFWNTPSNMFFKSTSVLLDLGCGKKRPNHMDLEPSHWETSANFWPLLRRFQGFQGILLSAPENC